MSRTLDEVLRDYVAAWNEPGDAERGELLRASVTGDVVMAPGYKPDAPPVYGREELSAEIGAMVARRPADGEYRLTLAGEPEGHHGWARFRWRLADPAGTALVIQRMEVVGLDVVHLSHDGRLDTIVVFLG